MTLIREPNGDGRPIGYKNTAWGGCQYRAFFSGLYRLGCNTVRDGFITCSVAVALFLCATGVWAREAKVTTTDGRTLTGEVLSDDDRGITLIISGIKTPLARDAIRDVRYLLSVKEQFDQQRADLADDDVDGRYKLAYWLYDRKAYSLAIEELDGLAKAFPNDTRVSTLSSVVAARIKLQHERETARSGPKPGHRGLPVDKSRSPQPESTGPAVLTPDQIALIKVYEIDLDAKPKVIVPREVVDRILSDYADRDPVPRGKRQQAKFRNSPGYQQLAMIFDLRARELYDQVRIKSDPRSLRKFRTDIHRRYVLNYCGTVSCHGGDGAGDFRVVRHRPNDDSTVYTNFFILNATGVANHVMIDRQEPDRSLLLQYGLPPKTARMPHPDTRGWRPHLSSEDGRRFRAIEQWIGTLWRPKPDYGIDYELPELGQSEVLPDEVDDVGTPAVPTAEPLPK